MIVKRECIMNKCLIGVLVFILCAFLHCTQQSPNVPSGPPPQLEPGAPPAKDGAPDGLPPSPVSGPIASETPESFVHAPILDPKLAVPPDECEEYCSMCPKAVKCGATPETERTVEDCLVGCLKGCKEGRDPLTLRDCLRAAVTCEEIRKCVPNQEPAS